MAYPKQVNAINVETKKKAVLEYAGFVGFVSGKVKKLGLENVLTNPDLAWLKKAYGRVLNFAEQVQIKEIPTKLGGDEENPIKLHVYLPERKLVQ